MNLRLKNKIRRRKAIVSPEEFDNIRVLASAANEILEKPRFAFFRKYLDDSLKSVEIVILENTVKDVKEELTISDKLKKVFFTPKKVQVDELVGTYKFIKKLYRDLKSYSNMEKDLDEKIAKKEVILTDEKRKKRGK